ncbi:GTP-binding protein [Aspergillus nomiae NRRL 13137]|uniref:GTP-binding protein n=1 Tax=Aspergillus nomiae NRRL (strain ATCC 15546 / NRRL 13137 / CBS 260.88 / M93) TaxID=1509407 RepID=A0A0L1IMJ8_ASPN3|nr:GTP-binding protein [Aspergillus nomiae NRRL 13137]KNG80814.1 GTP-binding protein [Aspergillus nomiae NRRL 13137]
MSPVPKVEVQEMAPANEANAMRNSMKQSSLPITKIQGNECMEYPSLSQIISSLAPMPPGLAPAVSEPLPLEEQRALFDTLEKTLGMAETRYQPSLTAKAEEDNPSFKQVDALFEGLQDTLCRLWTCRSSFMVQAAEALANGSRNPLWRLPYGQSGVLTFFLQLIASKEDVDTGLLLHALRLIGNSCADTDENRTIVVKGNYISAIIQHLLNPELIQIVIPVIYNICIDFEPAQSQLAASKIVYIFLKLLREDSFKEHETLLDFVYELIELTTEQEQGIELSPDETISLLIDLAVHKGIAHTAARFSCIVTCSMAYLDNKRFQNLCITRYMVADVLSMLSKSLSFDAERSSTDDIQVLAQVQLRINQTLAEISGASLFAEYYPLGSDLSGILRSWLQRTEDQLQICSCVMLGNLARSDEICQAMVRDLSIHRDLISIVKSDARGPVLHAALGFLKNLAIAGDNRLHLGQAGIIPAVSHLWEYETLPQVQFAATSIVRQVIIASFENVSQLLDISPEDEHHSTYLSQLLSLFNKTDSTPIRTEIGRIIASICRTLIPKSREQNEKADATLKHLFSIHEGIAFPIGAMISQSQWPVVRSEGWFALALMASSQSGSAAAVDCIEKMGLFPTLEQNLTAESLGSMDEADKLQLIKDRDNIIVLIQEILKQDPIQLSESAKSTLQGLMNSQVLRHLESTRER